MPRGGYRPGSGRKKQPPAPMAAVSTTPDTKLAATPPASPTPPARPLSGLRQRRAAMAVAIAKVALAADMLAAAQHDLAALQVAP
jgi:hypothetical protein